MDSTYARTFVMLVIVDLVLHQVVNIVNSGKPPFFFFISFHLLTLSRCSLPNQCPWSQSCNAPSAYPDTEPCMATVTVTCPCERIKQFSPCGRQASYGDVHSARLHLGMVLSGGLLGAGFHSASDHYITTTSLSTRPSMQ